MFDLGQLVATPGALAALEKSGQSPMDFLSRHVTGDWGEIPEEDRKENQFSLEEGFRLMSSYRIHSLFHQLLGRKHSGSRRYPRRDPC